MDILHALGTVAGPVLSVASGGITGLLGSALQMFGANAQKKQDLKEIELRNAHELNMLKANAELMREEWAQRVKVAEVEGEARVSVADSQAFSVALTSDPKRFAEGLEASKGQAWLMFLLDFFRGSIRPGLTLYLCAITTAIWLQARELTRSGLTAEQAVDLNTQVVNTILYLTTTCVLFWFGTRNQQKPPKVK